MVEASTTDVPLVEVSVLGPVRARLAGAELALGGPRQQAVLARLALAEGGALPAERMVDELWDGDPPATALQTLQSYVSNLRRILGGPATIERVGVGYRLNRAEVAITTVRFEQLVAEASSAPDPQGQLAVLTDALELWHGAALGDLADEPWAQGHAVRLTELRLAAEEARGAAMLEVGQASLAVAQLEALAQAHPLREHLTGLLVLALYRAGRQAEALRAYERLRILLADELGLSPGPELERLVAQVLAQDPELDRSQRPPASTPAPPSDDATPPPVRSLVLPLPPAVDERRARTPFVGRAGELASLGQAWSIAGAGSPHLAVISGEPGAGKTRLAQQAARRFHDQGANVLWGRCTPERLIAFQPVVEAFRTGARSLSRADATSLTRSRPALAALLPDLAGAEHHPERIDRWQLYEAVADLVAEATVDRPLLLVIDDLQWADDGTLGLVDHLLERGRDARALVLATVRRPAGRPTPELDRLVVAARRERRLTEVALQGMQAEEVAVLLGQRGVAVDAELAQDLCDRTAGNPFFLEALVEHGSAEPGSHDLRAVPASVRDLLDDRLRALDEPSLQVLSAAAVIGPRIDLAILGAVVELGPDELLDAVDQAVAASLLVEDEDLGWVSFPHALVRSALVSRTTRNREAHLHLRIADVVEARPHDLDREPTIARHLLAAGRLAAPVRTALAAVAAGHRALTGLADEDARAWADRALSLLPEAPSPEPEVHRAQVEALLLLAEAERLLGEPSPIRPAHRRAVDAVAGRSIDPALLAGAAGEAALMAVGHSYPWGITSTDPVVVELLERAIEAVPADDAQTRTLLRSWSAMALVASPDHDLAVARAEEALASIELVGSDPTARTLLLLNCRQVIAVPDELDRRIDLVLDAVAQEGITDFGLYICPPGFASTQLLEAGRLDEAELQRQRHRERIGTRNGPYYTAYVRFMDGLHAFLEGRTAEAEALYDEGMAMGEPNHAGPGSQWDIGRRVMSARARGREASLTDLVDRLAERRPDALVTLALRARAQVAAGDEVGAAATIGSLDEGRLAEAGSDLLGYLAVDLLAEIAWLLAHRGLGRAVAAVAAPWTGRVGVIGQGAVATGPLDLAIGLARSAAGDRDGAAIALDRAVALAEPAGWAPTLRRASEARAALGAGRS